MVWIRDTRRNARLYYAHLDSQLVSPGQAVEVGDTVGFVGNTGNAITTPPHLHFGVYSRGPVDPAPFIRPPRGTLPRLAANTDVLGGWANLTDIVELRRSPTRESETSALLERDATVRLLGGAGEWYRVRLADGRGGWVLASLAQPAAGRGVEGMSPPVTAFR